MRKILSPLILKGDFDDALEVTLQQPHGIDSFAFFLKSRGYTGFDLESSTVVKAYIEVPGDDAMPIELVCMGPWYLPEMPSGRLVLYGEPALRATIKLAATIGRSSVVLPPEWGGICDALASGRKVEFRVEDANGGILIAS